MSTAAIVTFDVRVRDHAEGTPTNPEGIYGGLITSGIFDNPDTLLDQEIRVERSISTMDARIAVNGGRLSALASGFWASSNSDTPEPSYGAWAGVRVHDSFTISGAGAPVSLDFQVALDGGIEAMGANAWWQMNAYLTQGFIGTNPDNPGDYARNVFLVGTWDPVGETGAPPAGFVDYQFGLSEGLTGGTYSSSTTYMNPAAFFERDVPIEVFWILTARIDDGNTPIGSPGSASANFYNTATWLGITARDAEGNVVEGLETIGASGYDWVTGEPPPVPLPATSWLVLTGLLAIAAARR